MNRRFVLSFLFVVAGVTAGLVLSGRFDWADETASAPGRAGAPATPADQAAGRQLGAPVPAVPALPDFSGVATRAVTGVVNISSLQEARVPNSPFASDPFFRYFFGDDEEFFGSRSRRSLSLGSGVVVSADGYIVTNSHVIGDNVREVSAVLPDKREVRT